MADLLERIEIETGPAPTASVVWLHGLGADGHDFEPVVPDLRLPSALRVRFVFPHAPRRPVTVNGGMVMRAWYDIRVAGGVRAPDLAGLQEAEGGIQALIRRERERGVAAGRIVLAGFSQGGAMALHTGLRYGERLAGLIGLSCSHPRAESLPAEASAVGRGLPVFVAHGRDDDMVPVARGRETRDTLTGLGYAVTWREYPIPHSVSGQEIDDISAWLQAVLRATA